jgi:hypothetical protein
MYRSIKNQGLKTFLLQEAPYGLTALVIAELFYKFKSFSLECAAFLLTWFVLGFLANQIARMVLNGKAQDQ